jgi:hypothetical protein
MGTFIYGCYLKLTNSNTLKYVSTIIDMVENMTLICLVFQFINVVLLLRQRYKCLNMMLNSHSHVWRDRTKSTGTNILPLQDTDTFGSSYCNMTSFRRQIFEKRHIYIKLYDIVLLVNSGFGLPIFLLTCWIFLRVVLISYAFCCILCWLLILLRDMRSERIHGHYDV